MMVYGYYGSCYSFPVCVLIINLLSIFRWAWFLNSYQIVFRKREQFLLKWHILQDWNYSCKFMISDRKKFWLGLVKITAEYDSLFCIVWKWNRIWKTMQLACRIFKLRKYFLPSFTSWCPIICRKTFCTSHRISLSQWIVSYRPTLM